MMLMCPRWLFWLPGLFLFCVSLLLAMALELGALLVGPMRFSIHTLLVAGTGMIVAVQLMTFAIYTERLAGLIGFRGRIKGSRDGLATVSLEHGLLVGLVLRITGFGLLTWQTMAWRGIGFGPLDPEVTMRAVIPAVVCIIHGFQIGFGSFFLSFLNLSELQLRE